MPPTSAPEPERVPGRALALVVLVLAAMAGWAVYFVQQDRAGVVTLAAKASMSEAVTEANQALTTEVSYLIAAGVLAPTGALEPFAGSADSLAGNAPAEGAIAADDRGVAALSALQAVGFAVPEQVAAALAPLSEADRAAARAATPISVPSITYEAAVVFMGQQWVGAQETTRLALAELLTMAERPDPWREPTFVGVLVVLAALGAVGGVALRRDFHRGEAHAKRLQDQIHRLGELLDVARKVSSEMSFDAAAQRLMEGARSLVTAEFAVVFQVDGDKIATIACQGIEPSRPFRVGSGVVGGVVETANPGRAVIQDDPSFGTRNGWTSLLAAPMVIDGRVVGALAVGSTFGVPFTDEDEFALKLFALAASPSLQNARQHEETADLVNSDPLTGLANRRRLDGDLRHGIPKLVAQGYPIAFAMVDVDHFKNFNDTYGHPAGDALLQQVASAIAGAVRNEDVVYRYGGEEFSVLLPGASPSEAMRVAERVRWAVQNTPMHDDQGRPVPPITVSVGVSHRIDANTEALVAEADGALYTAKQAGRNRVIAAP